MCAVGEDLMPNCLGLARILYLFLIVHLDVEIVNCIEIDNHIILNPSNYKIYHLDVSRETYFCQLTAKA